MSHIGWWPVVARLSRRVSGLHQALRGSIAHHPVVLTSQRQYSSDASSENERTAERMLELFSKNTKMQEMMMMSLPAAMRSPEAIQAMLANPAARKAIANMIASKGLKIPSQMLDSMDSGNMDAAFERATRLGLNPGEVFRRLLGYPKLLEQLQGNPKVMQALMDVSQDPRKAALHEPDILEVVNKIQSILKASSIPTGAELSTSEAAIQLPAGDESYPEPGSYRSTSGQEPSSSDSDTTSSAAGGSRSSSGGGRHTVERTESMQQYVVPPGRTSAAASSSGPANSGGDDDGAHSTERLLDLFSTNANMREMMMMTLPENMRNPETIQAILADPTARRAIAGMLKEKGVKLPTQMLDSMSSGNVDAAFQRAASLGVNPAEVFKRLMGHPELLSRLQARPQAMQALMDVSQDPTKGVHYDSETMEVVTQIQQILRPPPPGSPAAVPTLEGGAAGAASDPAAAAPWTPADAAAATAAAAMVGLPPLMSGYVAVLSEDPEMAIKLQDPRIQRALHEIAKSPWKTVKYIFDKDVMTVFTALQNVMKGKKA